MSTQRRKRVLKKIIFVGDPDVGKTSFLYMYLEKKFQNRRSTIGADFATKEVLINDTPVTLQIWDTAGREKWAHPGIAFFRGADGVIMFYDTTNKRSFENIAKWREDILKHAQNASVILVGTKTDLENKRQVRMEDAEELAQAWNIPCIEVSSKEDLGVQEAVRLLLDQMQLDEEEEELVHNNPPPAPSLWQSVGSWMYSWFQPTPVVEDKPPLSKEVQPASTPNKNTKSLPGN
mmetsp:Transcript_17958/g.25054  ORF Transcript_17958/g.25054 Transcript_17958/m.25054 type:complete len:234 (-) Transcript_17958:2618-3319(-)